VHSFINSLLPISAFIFLIILPFNYLLNYKFSFKYSLLLTFIFFSAFSFIILVSYHLLSIWVVIIFYVFIYLSILRNKKYHRNFNSKFILDISIIILATCLLWFLLFYKNYLIGNIESDIMFQVGFVNELKHSLIPKNPHWFDNEPIHYHILTHYNWAALSLFTNVPSVSIVFLTSNVIICFSIILLIYFFLGPNRYAGILILFLFIFYQHSENYDYLLAVKKNMSGHNAGSFFWSLPLFIGSLFLYKEYDKYRNNIISKPAIYKYLEIIIFGLIFPLLIFYSKSNFLLFFVSAEILFLLRALYNNLGSKVSKIRYILSYSPFFITTLLIYLILPYEDSSWYGVAFIDFSGLNTMKFETFHSIYNSSLVFANFNEYLQSLLYSIISIYLFTFIMMILFKSRVNSTSVIFLISGFASYAYSLILNHPGNSDLYFVGNALIVNMIICQILMKKNDI
tara:strand:+ start:3625 stop:4986 length:1362 start_codon:yes stop_codon:yes gene_type:complete